MKRVFEVELSDEVSRGLDRIAQENAVSADALLGLFVQAAVRSECAVVADVELASSEGFGEREMVVSWRDGVRGAVRSVSGSRLQIVIEEGFERGFSAGDLLVGPSGKSEILSAEIIGPAPGGLEFVFAH